MAPRSWRALARRKNRVAATGDDGQVFDPSTISSEVRAGSGSVRALRPSLPHAREVLQLCKDDHSTIRRSGRTEASLGSRHPPTPK